MRRLRTSPALAAAAASTFGLTLLATGNGPARATFAPAPGYQVASLNLQADAIAVSPGGRLAVARGDFFANTLTISLYDTWRPGRTLLNSATYTSATSSPFASDLAFLSESSIVLGESGPTDTLHTIDFTAATPTFTPVAPANTFPNVQGVALADGGASVLVSGTTATGFGTRGGLYLRKVPLAGGPVTSIVENTGAGFVGDAALSPAGSPLLIDTGPANKSGIVRRYNNAAASPETLAAPLGDGTFKGAYAIAFDNAAVAYVSSDTKLARVTGLDGGAAATAAEFGVFTTDPSEFPAFLTSLAFAGGDFRAFHPEDTGALLFVNGGFTSEDGLYVITPVPEPAAAALVCLGGALAALRRRRRSIAALGVVALCGASARADQFFATTIESVTPGSRQATIFSQTSRALGGPRGDVAGVDQSLDVYNLGIGGSITLSFNDGAQQRVIHDAAGPDFLVFENPVNAGPNTVFAELMFVEVSSNGIDFARFPTLSDTPGPVEDLGTIDPRNVSGFAGVCPVFADIDTPTGPNPFNPATAGGDPFDLARLLTHPLVESGAVDLQNVRYVRLIDILGDGSTPDFRGLPIYDGTGDRNNGADLDALAVINGAHLPEPTAATILLATLAVTTVRRHRSLRT